MQAEVKYYSSAKRSSIYVTENEIANGNCMMFCIIVLIVNLTNFIPLFSG
jgi:hypothetical protein